MPSLLLLEALCASKLLLCDKLQQLKTIINVNKCIIQTDCSSM